MTGDHDDTQKHLHVTGPVHQCLPAASRHLDVADQDLYFISFQKQFCLSNIGRLKYFFDVAFAPVDRLDQRSARPWLVIHDQGLIHFCYLLFSAFDKL